MSCLRGQAFGKRTTFCNPPDHNSLQTNALGSWILLSVQGKQDDTVPQARQMTPPRDGPLVQCRFVVVMIIQVPTSPLRKRGAHICDRTDVRVRPDGALEVRRRNS